MSGNLSMQSRGCQIKRVFFTNELEIQRLDTISPDFSWFDGGKSVTKAILFFFGTVRWPY